MRYVCGDDRGYDKAVVVRKCQFPGTAQAFELLSIWVSVLN